MTEPTLTTPGEAPKQGVAQVEQFAAKCAHDFNNLLTGILGNLELMQNRARKAGVKDFDNYMEGARNAAGRAAAFSQRLLHFSGRAAGETEDVPVNPLVHDLVEVLREHQGPIAATLAPDAGSAFCDPAQLEIALMELLANARDAVGAESEISIATSREGRNVVIAVTDHGAGMNADILALAPQPFFSTRLNGAGKGLGLAIVDRFTREAGGRLVLASALDAGTTARLILPAAPG